MKHRAAFLSGCLGAFLSVDGGEQSRKREGSGGHYEIVLSDIDDDHACV